MANVKQIDFFSAQNLLDIHREFQDFTMLHRRDYLANLALCGQFDIGPSGLIVECGTWKGGMIAGIAKLLGNKYEYKLFDSFEGLPAATSKDGDDAIRWQSDTESETYFNNCAAQIDFAKEAMSRAGIETAEYYKGWFEDTLPDLSLSMPISILRLDADWFESTLTILSSLYDKVRDGGLIIIDDYYTWDGCTKAVHQFFNDRELAERVRQYDRVAYIIKGSKY